MDLLENILKESNELINLTKEYSAKEPKLKLLAEHEIFGVQEVQKIIKKHQTEQYHNIAIDGPAGAGKTTVAKLLAKKLGFTYVDTGAMYRAFAVYFLRNSISGEDTKAIEQACQNIRVKICYENEEQRVFLNDEDVTELIRTEEVSQMASVSSAVPTVRNALLELQRDMARKGNVVMEGRDIGSYVLPDAELKIFLTASPEIRAERRYNELKRKGENPIYYLVLSDIMKRDHQDSTRETAPLKRSPDAVYIDSSEMTIGQVFNIIHRLIRVKTGEIMFHVRSLEDDCQEIGIVTDDYEEAEKYFTLRKEDLIRNYDISEETYDVEYDTKDLFSARNKDTGRLCQVDFCDIPVI